MSLYEIVFSPTGGTSRAAGILAAGLGTDPVRIDLTEHPSHAELGPDDVAVIAVPSFGGRVPRTATERIASLHGGGARTVLMCVYGNRAFEDTLIELADTAESAGFKPVAAVAAVAEHSIARKIATGRPDARDEEALRGFAEQIRRKLEAKDASEPAIPGERLYKKSGGTGLVPKPTRNCTSCGACAAHCPVGAIDPSDPGRVDKDACISCMRCVAVCPARAREVNPVKLAAVGVALKKMCAQRREPELFI